jgi:hypothetical protein
MKLYFKVCVDCKQEFYCQGKACTDPVFINNLTSCHCPKCTQDLNDSGKRDLYFEECPKYNTKEEVTVEEL